MNRIDWLTDELIEAAFERRADRVAPDGLRDGILSQTAATRQRRAWHPRLTGPWSMPSARPAWVAIAVLVALVGLAIALALVGRRPTSPFRTGLLAYVSGGDVYLARPDGSNAEVVLHQDGAVFLTVAWSPEGGRLAIDGESGAVLVDSATGTATFIGGTNPVWSPDGRQLAVLDLSPGGAAADGAHLRIVDAATDTTIRTVPFPAIGGLAWSPNGRWIAATGGTNGSESNSLVRIDVATGDVTELDGPSGLLDSERQPAWSPDSSHIAFIRWGLEKLAGCHDDPLCTTDIFVANADGSQALRVNKASGKADHPSWSPDGRWIAFLPANRAGIVISHPDGTGERTIAAAGVETFAWGPESDRLRFISSAGQGSTQTIGEATLDGAVQTVDVQIGAAPNLFERTGTQFDWQALDAGRDVPGMPSVAALPSPAAFAVVTPAPADPADPSGTWPTLVSQSEDGCKPMTIASGTGAVATITNVCGAFPVSAYGWSPSGSFYSAVIDQSGSLTLVRRDGHVDSQVDRLTGLDGFFWSPDEQWLGVHGARNYVLRPDGSGLQEIPGDPIWSPDGRTLGVTRPDGQLLVGGPDGSDLHTVGSFPAPISWSPDGSRFAFLRDGDAWMATRDGADLRNLTSLPVGGASMVAWSPDDRWIAVGASHGLWLVPLDGGPRRWFGLGLGESDYNIDWAPGADRLAVETYTDGSSGGQQAFVYLVDPSGPPAIRIDSAGMPSWSPDGRFLVVTHSSPGGGPGDGLIDLMNSDGSGRRELSTPAGLSPAVWAR
jgi:Tol biopolymer transport system component